MITGRTPAAAAQALRDALQPAVACVTAAVLILRRDAVDSELSVTSRLAVASGEENLAFSIRYFFGLVSDASTAARHRWQVRATAYQYRLDDGDGREILAYHWHPRGRSHVTVPHLHLGAGAGTLRSELVKAHLSTGIVTPVALLALLLDQFRVRPRRVDWPVVLDHARRMLESA